MPLQNYHKMTQVNKYYLIEIYPSFLRECVIYSRYHTVFMYSCVPVLNRDSLNFVLFFIVLNMTYNVH
jgi:hypothetical protein